MACIRRKPALPLTLFFIPAPTSAKYGDNLPRSPRDWAPRAASNEEDEWRWNRSFLWAILWAILLILSLIIMFPHLLSRMFCFSCYHTALLHDSPESSSGLGTLLMTPIWLIAPYPLIYLKTSYCVDASNESGLSSYDPSVNRWPASHLACTTAVEQQPFPLENGTATTYSLYPSTTAQPFANLVKWASSTHQKPGICVKWRNMLIVTLDPQTISLPHLRLSISTLLPRGNRLNGR